MRPSAASLSSLALGFHGSAAARAGGEQRSAQQTFPLSGIACLLVSPQLSPLRAGCLGPIPTQQQAPGSPPTSLQVVAWSAALPPTAF